MRLAVFLSVVLSGCSLLLSETAEIGLGVEVPRASLDGEITLRGREVRLPLEQPTTAGVVLAAEPYKTEAGPATVACTIREPGIDRPFATVTLDLDLEADWRYIVNCLTAATDPADVCFGCRGSTSAALDPSLGLPAEHRLWLVWGGDPIDALVLYGASASG